VLLVSHDRDVLDRVVTSTLASEGDGVWTEYAGGYSDMMAQRGAPSTAAPEEKPKKPRESAPRAERPKAARLSFKEKHALETLPKRIAELEGEIARLQGVLADGNLYARNPAAFEKAAGTLRDAEAARAQAEDEWLTLEMKREELDEA
ncbi:MAG TPA: ABC transporter ATP-binding protein, partial [Alphaproteobacteria bacterium]|nr:ABC transporter ATP-binding protein [Alphaproteobacteria bacterium]